MDSGITENLPSVDQSFYEKLVQIYEKLDIKVSLTKNLEQAELDEYAKKGAIAISYCPPAIETAAFKQCFTDVLTLFAEFQPAEDKTLKELVQITAYSSKELTDKLSGLFSGKHLEELFHLYQYPMPSLAGLVLAYTIKPFLQSFSLEIMKDYPLHHWEKGYCPVCGNGASLARLSKNENGKRYLMCSVCETRWAFARIACPFCLEKNPDNLGYFRLEEDQGYKVNFCRSCKSYIKTFDESGRVLSTKSIFLEDKETAYLDHLAQREGFKNLHILEKFY